MHVNCQLSTVNCQLNEARVAKNRFFTIRGVVTGRFGKKPGF